MTGDTLTLTAVLSGAMVGGGVLLFVVAVVLFVVYCGQT